MCSFNQFHNEVILTFRLIHMKSGYLLSLFIDLLLTSPKERGKCL
jgi:hypothetical protein